ncbi:MAG TPA: type II toxin-antitoxin system RelE/ParE family toxin [Rhodothermales bacterium]|nr:type II toxin-antitoxin system RelE/ParE family toxin [Rhodothermales bacterium]
MTDLIWSPASVGDLESIRTYVADDSVLYADLVVRRIVAAVERLKTFPESGRMVPERDSPEIREVIVGPYRVVYRVRSESVEIVTVFRASRRFPESVE